MGYGYYVLPDGREAGYAVEATCDEPGCDEHIDRGLAYLCGDHPGDESTGGCTRYFCYGHLLHTEVGQRCERCADAIDDEDDE